jgi:hypothetical protein
VESLQDAFVARHRRGGHRSGGDRQAAFADNKVVDVNVIDIQKWMAFYPAAAPARA